MTRLLYFLRRFRVRVCGMRRPWYRSSVSRWWPTGEPAFRWVRIGPIEVELHLWGPQP